MKELDEEIFRYKMLKYNGNYNLNLIKGVVELDVLYTIKNLLRPLDNSYEYVSTLYTQHQRTKKILKILTY